MGADPFDTATPVADNGDGTVQVKLAHPQGGPHGNGLMSVPMSFAAKRWPGVVAGLQGAAAQLGAASDSPDVQAAARANPTAAGLGQFGVQAAQAAAKGGSAILGSTPLGALNNAGGDLGAWLGGLAGRAPAPAAPQLPGGPPTLTASVAPTPGGITTPAAPPAAAAPAAPPGPGGKGGGGGGSGGQDAALAKGFADEAAANDAESKAQQAQNTALLPAKQSAVDATAAAAQRQQEIATKAQDYYDSSRAQQSKWIQDLHETKVDPERWWNSRADHQKFMAGLSMALGGIGSGITGQKADDVVTQAIDRDIDAQKTSILNKKSAIDANQNLMAEAMKQFGDQRQAAEAVKVAKIENVQKTIDYVTSSTSNPIYAANAQKLNAKLEQQKVDAIAKLHDTNADVALKQAEAAHARAEAGAVAPKGGAGKVANGVHDHLGNLIGTANDPAEAARLSKRIAAQADLEGSATRLHGVIEQNPIGVNLPLGKANSDLQTEVENLAQKYADASGLKENERMPFLDRLRKDSLPSSGVGSNDRRREKIAALIKTSRESLANDLRAAGVSRGGAAASIPQTPIGTP